MPKPTSTNNSHLPQISNLARVSVMNNQMHEDARFARLAKVRQAKSMSPQEKFYAGYELFEEACTWTLAGIAAQYPNATEAEKKQELQRRLKLADSQMQ